MQLSCYSAVAAAAANGTARAATAVRAATAATVRAATAAVAAHAAAAAAAAGHKTLLTCTTASYIIFPWLSFHSCHKSKWLLLSNMSSFTDKHRVYGKSFCNHHDLIFKREVHLPCHPPCLLLLQAAPSALPSARTATLYNSCRAAYTVNCRLVPSLLFFLLRPLDSTLLVVQGVSMAN